VEHFWGDPHLLRNVSKNGILVLLPEVTSIRQREEVGRLADILINFIVSVGAGVVAYYICKWLDRHP